MKKESKEKLNTVQVIERLGAKHPSGAYAFLTQVRNGTGYAREVRTADAISMSLWPSRGLDLTGYEVKVSRTDWIRELREPSKADAIAQYCDYWCLVVGDEDIVQLGELPKTWGLYVPDKKHGLKLIVEPTRLKAKPIDRVTLAGLMRNVSEKMVAKDLIESQLEAARERGKEWAKHSMETLQNDLKKLRDAIKVFEDNSGVRINEWASSNVEVGVAVKHVLEGKHLKAAKKLVQLTERAEKIVKYLKGEAVNEWEM